MGQEVAAQRRLLVIHQLGAQKYDMRKHVIRPYDLDKVVAHGASPCGSAYCSDAKQQERGDIAGNELSTHAVHQLFHRRPPNRPARPLRAGDETLHERSPSYRLCPQTGTWAPFCPCATVLPE